MYYVFDILGMNIIERMKKDVDVKVDIRCCLYGLYLGYYVIIFVLLVIEMIINELFELFGDLFEENVYDYMIIIIIKVENDENKLNELLKDFKMFKNLKIKCEERVVIFGNNLEYIFGDCVKKFDDIFINFIIKNSKLGKEYYIYKYSIWVKKWLKKDEEDFLRKNFNVDKNEVFYIVKIKVVEGLFLCDKELKSYINKFCFIF